MTKPLPSLLIKNKKGLLTATLCLITALLGCKARHDTQSSATLSRSTEVVDENADLSQFSTCIQDPQREGLILCLPYDEYVFQENIKALAKDGNVLAPPSTPQNRQSEAQGERALQLDTGYAAGTLDNNAASSPDEAHEFQRARIEKCYRSIHVFIGVTVEWGAKDKAGKAVIRKYVTGANKSDDGTVYAKGEASCSEIVTMTSAAKFAAYVRRVPAINNAANPAGVSVFTGVCAPLTGAPCHNAVYEHCVYLKGSGDLSNSVGVAPVLLKCVDSIFGK